jgi:hypothetical protein
MVTPADGSSGRTTSDTERTMELALRVSALLLR